MIEAGRPVFGQFGPVPIKSLLAFLYSRRLLLGQFPFACFIVCGCCAELACAFLLGLLEMGVAVRFNLFQSIGVVTVCLLQFSLFCSVDFFHFNSAGLVKPCQIGVSTGDQLCLLLFALGFAGLKFCL